MTLHNWKTILENWINCYFERPSNLKQKVEVQSLLNIISHLRENLCLDDSKSSLVEAQTLEEFIQEKFPGVVFQNGGVEVTNENELYIVASLLLFFVCVNSKDIDIKNAMCNKLSVNDQETIMKFTKLLMETTVITFKDVQNAITEACTDPTASVERCTIVAETPPAIRNMHGEVRRLQAALEAERFDKNFLQEELSRTNHKLEKLTQDKEQYKVDILALKAKISNCCGQESDRQSSNEDEHNASVKLLRQLEEMEERLVDTQTQLDEAVHERNIYKAKVEEVKVERNKWINSCQEESSRAAALSQQLEVEHHNNELLKELVADLRRHNDHNIVDTSQLECDDPDVSLQSIGRNMSVCNEVCANVIEVQLSEERAKIDVLQQEINLLQEKLQQVEQSASEDKTSLLELISYKDEEIESLNLTIKEEVEKQISLEKSLTNDATMLNNRINVLEQIIKENQEVANRVHEEKKSLLEKNNALKIEVKDMESENEEIKAELEKTKNLQVIIQENYKVTVKEWNEKMHLLNVELGKWLHLSEESPLSDGKEEPVKMTQPGDDKVVCGDSDDDNQCFTSNSIVEINQDFKQQIDNLKNKLKDLLHIKDTEIAKLNCQLRAEIEKYISLKESLNDDIRRLHSDISCYEVKLNNCEQSAREDKASLLQLISRKDEEIENLNVIIKEEVEKQISLEKTFTNNVTMLNNRINDLGQIIKEHQKVANRDQEEKKSLLEIIKDIETDNQEIRTELNETKNSLVIIQQNYEVTVNEWDEKVCLINEDLDKWLLSSIENSSGDGKEEPVEMTRHYDDKVVCVDSDDYNQRFTSNSIFKMNDFKQEIDKLGIKLKEYQEIANRDKVTLKDLLTSKDTEITKLKCQFKAEIEKYISTKESLDDEITKLHSDISCCELKLNECEQSASEDKASLLKLISRKDEEIESLNLAIKEEAEKKICLEKSLTNDVTVLNNRINDLGLTIKEYHDVANKDQNEKISLLEKINALKKGVKDIETENEEIRTELNNTKNSHGIIQVNYEVTLKEWNEKIQLLIIKFDKWLHSSKENISNDSKEEEPVGISQHSNDKVICGDSDDCNQRFTSHDNIEINQNPVDFKQQFDNLENKLKELLSNRDTEIAKLNCQVRAETEKYISFKESLDDEIRRLHSDISCYEIKLYKCEQLASEEKTSLLELISRKDEEIGSLNLAIKEEVEKQISLEKSLTNNVTVLNNKVNELELRIKDNQEVANRDEEEKMSLLEKINALKKEVKDVETENEEIKTELNKTKNSYLIINGKYEVTIKEWNEKIQLLNVNLDKWLHSTKENTANNSKEEEHVEISQHSNDKVICGDSDDYNQRFTSHDNVEINQKPINFKQHIGNLENKLKELISNRDTEIAKLNCQVRAETEKCISFKESLDDEIRRLHSDISCYEIKLNKCEQLASEEKTSLLELISRKDEEIGSLNLAIKEEVEKQISLEKSLTNDVTVLNNKVNELELKIKDNLEVANRDQEEKNSLLEKINALKKEVKNIELEKEELRTELNKTKDSQVTVQQNYEVTAKECIEKLQLLNVTLDKWMISSQENNPKESVEITQHDDDKDVYGDSYDSNHIKRFASNAIIEINLEPVDFKQQIDNLESKLKRYQEIANRDKDSLIELLSSKDTKIAKLKRQVKSEIEKYISLKESLDDEITKLHSDISCCEVKLNECEQSASEDKASLLELISRKDKEIESLNLAIKEGVEKQIRLEKSLTNDVTMLNNKINELGQTIKEYQEVANTDQEEKISLLEKINVLKKEVKDIETENEEIKTELNKSKNSQVIDQENYAVKEWNKKVQLINLELDKWLHSSKEDSSRDGNQCFISNATVEMNLEPVDFKQQIDNLENKLKQYQEIVNIDKVTLRELLSSKDEEIAKLDCQVKAEIEKYISLNKTLDDTVSRLHSDKTSLLELISRKDDEIESLNLAIKEEVEKQIRLEKSLTNDVTMLNNRINQLGQTIKENQEVANRDQEEKMLLLEKINVLKKEVKHMETENEEIKTEINKTKNSQVITQENYEITVKEWNKKVQLLNVEFDKWLHSSKDNTTRDGKEESIERMQHDDDKVVCGGDSVLNAVVEVKLNQESDDFKQQMHILENKLKQYQEIANRDKVTLKELLSSKDAEIAKLKCQVRAEIEKYISLKESLNDEIRRLHSDISYYEVKLNECEQLAYKELNQKVKDISTLQEDKLTLLKSLTDRIDGLEEKLETIECENHRLKNDLNKEQNSKMKMQDDYESHITKLNEKISKMSVTENRASQIIKVSAKYQAIILKRVAEIKSNTVLKELTNFGNVPCDNEVRRSLNAGSITMEELESFLETTDKHLRKCSEKQNALQKERDRLAAVAKIHESEIINMKKYLTELSVYFKTFGSVKQVYNQKLSQVVSQQRMVRREMLSVEERLTEGALAKLERGYTSVLQDLTECAMSFERWVERCISRTVSPEKICLSFTSEHASLSGGHFQNSSLESQLDEIERGFQRLLQDISRAQRGEGSKDAQTMTILEVKAEYEDKLERMKAKMKQIYQEQTTIFREKQREEVSSLERQLQHAREKLVESSRAYEEHIRGLTSELWNVGEKFLIEKNEADWLKRKCISGSLMSLQQVHSSGLVPPREDKPRPSDTYSLRSLPLHNKSEARTLHMSDEEGEVFDNRWLKELSATPRTRRSPQIGGEPRLSELRYRNSLCPPHLKSSYPAETQFAPTIDEEDIKCSGIGGRQRKEVGITAYKKPGPPTPSKQAGRLSATDSELREGLRSEPDATAPRKTSTPSRIRALFRSSKTLTDNTASPRRRLSIFRNKK